MRVVGVGVGCRGQKRDWKREERRGQGDGKKRRGQGRGEVSERRGEGRGAGRGGGTEVIRGDKETRGGEGEEGSRKISVRAGIPLWKDTGGARSLRRPCSRWRCKLAQKAHFNSLEYLTAYSVYTLHIL